MGFTYELLSNVQTLNFSASEQWDLDEKFSALELIDLCPYLQE